MSDINLDFTVSNNSIDFTVQPNDITFTPSDIQLAFYNSSVPLARGANMEVQYNNEGLLEGNPTFTFDQDVNLLSIANINTGGLQATGNVSIGGYVGSNVDITANTFLAANMVATTANIQNGTINANAITSIHSNLGNVGNVKIGGGVNGYVLQTDGTGNLDWAAAGGGGGNGTPGGSNTQIQYNDSGVFGGNAGFTFNEITGNVNIPGNLIVSGVFSGNATNANYANFAGNAFNVSGSNVSGQVANALIAGTVYTNAQPNITSVGTLTSVNVSGNTTLTSTTSLQQAIEKVTIYATANTGVVNYDLLSQAIIYNTANATANIGLNFRGNSSVTANTIMAVGNSMVATYVMTTGGTGYTIANIAIDGSAQAIKWAGNTVPNVYPATTTSFTFTIIKTASTPTYAVFGSATKYG